MVELTRGERVEVRAYGLLYDCHRDELQPRVRFRSDAQVMRGHEK